MKRLVVAAIVAICAVGDIGTAAAQPGDPWDDGSGGSAAGSGSAPAPTPADPPPPPPPDPKPADPVPATPPGPGSGSGSGSAATGSGSGSGSGAPVIIKLPTDVNAPEVSAAAGPSEVRLGAKFTLFITATFNAGVVVNLREPLELGPGFEVTRKLSEDKPTDDGRTQREWQVEVIAWELGDIALPPIAVTYTAFGKADQVATNRVRLRVLGQLGEVVDDPKALRGNADPRDLLSRDWFWLWVSIAAIVGVALVVGLALYLRARRRRVVYVGGTGFVGRGRKLDTPSARALEKLLAIENSGVLDRDDDRKQGYADMVEVIREYLGSRYRVATYDLTSYELLKQLDKVAPDGERDMIETWLDQCDIVKYGGFKASAVDAKRTLEDARTLVVSTTQAADPAPVAAEPEAPKEPPPAPPTPPPTPTDEAVDKQEAA